MFNTGVLNQYKQRSFIAFGSGTTTATQAIIPVSIPREARFVSFILVGPGGPGSSGTSSTSGTSRRGGGGGGGGAITTGIFNTRLLPETIYLLLPGTGGASGIGASISTIPSTVTSVRSHTILFARGGFGAGAGGAGGAAGAASTSATIGVGGVIGFSSTAGIAGTTSATATSSPSTTINTCFGAGGAAGASTNLTTPFAGGPVIVGASNTFQLPTSTVIVPAGLISGGAGVNGFHNLDNCTSYAAANSVLYSIPGSGGGSIDSGGGGAGGNGAPGCGGGGGGAATTGGASGLGGPAFSIVEWW